MSATLPPTVDPVEELRRQIEELRKIVHGSAGQVLPLWLGPMLQGVTIVVIAAGFFWLGSLSRTVSQTSDRVDKIYTIILESRDSLSARTSVTETKLDNIDKKLDQILSSQKK